MPRTPVLLSQDFFLLPTVGTFCTNTTAQRKKEKRKKREVLFFYISHSKDAVIHNYHQFSTH